MIPAIVLGVVLLASVTISVARSRRRRSHDLIVRHERAISILRDIYEHPLEGDEPAEVPPAARARAVAPAIARAPNGPDHGFPTIEPETASRSDAAVTAMSALATPMSRGSRAPAGAARYRRGVLAAATVAAAAVVIAAIAGVAINGNTSHRSASTTLVSNTSSAPSSTVSSAPPSTVAPTTVAAPQTYSVVDRNGRPTVVVHTPFALTVAATAPCWVQVRAAAGNTLFTGTLQAGQSQTIPVPANATLSLGNTRAATVTVDGTPVDTHTLSSTSNLDLSST